MEKKYKEFLGTFLSEYKKLGSKWDKWSSKLKESKLSRLSYEELTPLMAEVFKYASHRNLSSCFVWCNFFKRTHENSYRALLTTYEHYKKYKLNEEERSFDDFLNKISKRSSSHQDRTKQHRTNKFR